MSSYIDDSGKVCIEMYNYVDPMCVRVDVLVSVFVCACGYEMN